MSMDLITKSPGHSEHLLFNKTITQS